MGQFLLLKGKNATDVGGYEAIDEQASEHGVGHFILEDELTGSGARRASRLENTWARKGHARTLADTIVDVIGSNAAAPCSRITARTFRRRKYGYTHCHDWRKQKGPLIFSAALCHAIFFALTTTLIRSARICPKLP